MALGFGLNACAVPTTAPASLPDPAADLKPAESQTTATAILAGGCFWCTEAAFELLDGVSDVTSGYAGGSKADAKYEKVGAGVTGHAEAIRITYNPQKISYGKLLKVFFDIHDPTTKDRQGPDTGTQYRSAIFYENEDQKKVAEAYIKQLTDAKVFGKPIVTTVEPIGDGFFDAEAYHQNYVQHNPDNPYVQINSMPKVEKVKQKYTVQKDGK